MAKKIFVLAPTHSQPRFHKRVEQLSKENSVIIFYFSRNLYTENKFSDKYIQFNLGSIEDRKYFKRISKLVHAIVLINKKARLFKPSHFYAFGIDLAFVCLLAGFRKGILEVGDLIFPKGLGRLSRVLEYYLFSTVDAVILTSAGFLNGYKSWYFFRQGKIYIIDNKLSSFFSKSPRKAIQINKGPITIGIIGLLRYELPIIRLLSFVKKNAGKVRLVCYGDGPYKHLIIKESGSNIKFMGSFKNPEQLEKIYSDIDINYVVYDNNLLNEKLAIPNKLFESIFWCKPLIVSTNTYLSIVVSKLGVGGAIDYHDQSEFEESISKYVDTIWINSRIKNCISIPTTNLFDNNGAEVVSEIFKGK